MAYTKVNFAFGLFVIYVSMFYLFNTIYLYLFIYLQFDAAVNIRV
jgi:hypothetical protein